MDKPVFGPACFLYTGQSETEKHNITDSVISKKLVESVAAELGLDADNIDSIQRIDFETL